MTREDFETNIIEMQDKLYRISYGILQNPVDQADAVQECIAKAFAKRNALRNDEYMQTWVIRILINVCNDMLKKRKREFPVDELPVVIPPTGNRDMIEAFSEVEEKLRIPLILYHIEGYKTKEISRLLHTPESTVKGRLAKGRSKLKGILEKGELEYDRV